MKSVRYVCTHCGRKFEAEEKEIVECPGCFWSSSVKKEEDVRDELKSAAAGQSLSKAPSPVGEQLKRVLPFIGIFIVLVLIGVVIVFAAPAIQASFKKVQTKISEIKPKEKMNEPKTAPPSKISSAQSQAPVLSPAENAILQNRVQLSADRQPSAEEEKVLKNRAALKTGFIEKLPSQAWNLENFKKFLAEQERIYKIPLPRSYKNKLEDLFNQKYGPASEAFKSGDLLAARNLWVESLAFPIYGDNVNKHRGVVLTMLRPFISDTLSKVGAINGTLVEGKIREKEHKVAQLYEQLLQTLDQKKWKEADSQIRSLKEELAQLMQPAKIAGGPPPYPPDVQKVDEGIRATLFDILTVQPPAVSDFDAISRDIDAKQRVIQSFQPEQMQKMQTLYDGALADIQQQNWGEAVQKLRGITFPPELADDARKKLELLGKLQIRS